jgi:hypothetical protein
MLLMPLVVKQLVFDGIAFDVLLLFMRSKDSNFI